MSTIDEHNDESMLMSNEDSSSCSPLIQNGSVNDAGTQDLGGQDYTILVESNGDQTEDQEEDDISASELPRYCKQCDMWYHAWDPSYPFRCDCGKSAVGNGTGMMAMEKMAAAAKNAEGGGNRDDTLNTNDTQSVYSVHMRKDFR